MEVEKTVTRLPQPGVTVNPQTGEASVPTPDGGSVRVEVKGDGTPHFFFQDTPASRKLIDELIRKNDLGAEAAAARGQVYQPTIGTRAKNLLTSNITPWKMVAFVVIAGIGYGLGKRAARALSDYFGWGWFGGDMPEEEMYAGGNKDFDERKAPRPRRPAQQQPTQPTATA